MEKASKKKIAVLGSTGSVGKQVLEVVQYHEKRYSVEVLCAQDNVSLLIEQAMAFSPEVVIIGNTRHYQKVKEALHNKPIKVFAGEQSVVQVMEFNSFDVVFAAMNGITGLRAISNAIKNGKTIALANKEIMVVAGHLINKLSQQHRASIIPVDSEHSAIFQCLLGEAFNPVEKVYLTASGGPFRGMTKRQLEKVRKEDALRHPVWKMGAKTTVDSASMMNKGLEVIEASWFFGLHATQIDVIVHPEAVIHAIVQFGDGSMKAQMGLPDMRLPIQYALSYPERIHAEWNRLQFTDQYVMTFEKPDKKNFPCLELAYDALRSGGNMPCVLNASNEVAVQAFLSDQIIFTQIPDIISHCMDTATHIENPGMEDIFMTDTQTKAYAKEMISKTHKKNNKKYI